MTDEELKELVNLECAKLLKSEKGYNGISFQEFWAEGMKYGLAEGRKEKEKLKTEKDKIISELEELAANRKAFIDWCAEHHEEILKEYTGF